MILHDTGIEGTELTLGELDHVLQEIGFIRWAWDYDHATYDYKYEIEGSADAKAKNDVYYLRVTGHALDGVIENGETVLKLHEPYMGKTIFPHGIDYNAEIPKNIMEDAKKRLSQLKSKLDEIFNG